ncbi:MAG: hypothetical protein WD398_10895 [Cyclobacteriaceae bacterium]
MKKYLGLMALFACLAQLKPAMAQQAEGSFLISTGMDLFRSDLDQMFHRFQLAGELNYFYLHHLSLSLGYEYNTLQPNQVSGGVRFYPVEPIFIRARGLMGNNADIALGMGYTYNVTYRFRVEGMADYYIQNEAVGLRAGIAILIN